MANVDHSYILSLLGQTKTGEDGRLAFYQTQPYPAMRVIAEDRVYSLQLLIEAVQAGLLEQLRDVAATRDDDTGADSATEAFVDVADAERDEYVNSAYTCSTGRYTVEQVEGEACTRCGQPFAIGETSRPTGALVDSSQLFAHVICPPGGASR